MIKRIALLLAVLLFIPAFSSCGIPERLALDSDLHNVIEVGDTDEYIEEIFYRGVRYVRCDMFSAHTGFTPYEGDVMISWNGPRFFYINTYYSDTADSPLFIYEIRMESLYFREDYDYMNDTFTISETELTLSEMMGEIVAEKDIGIEYSFYVPIASITNPRLVAKLEIGRVGEDWCFSFLGSEKVWRATPKLLNAVGVQ